MDTERIMGLVRLMRQNAQDSARPNMKNAIEGGAPVAALVYGLAYIAAMSGFCCKGSDKVRYENFVRTYMRKTRSGFDYTQLDLYTSLRCDMLHGLIPGRPGKGRKTFVLIYEDTRRHLHGKPDGKGRVYLHVDTFCADALAAAQDFLQAVENAVSGGTEPKLVVAFWHRMDEQGYSTMVSV